MIKLLPNLHFALAKAKNNSNSVSGRTLELSERVIKSGEVINLALERLKQKNHKFKVSLGYKVRPCLKNKQKV
jgi:hypothetical protein